MPGYAISGNLGHSDPTMLMRTYAHEIKESNRRAADYMDELFAK
jgi:integrase